MTHIESDRSKISQSGSDVSSKIDLSKSTIKPNKLKNTTTPKLFEIDYVGTGTYQVSQSNILHRRSIEPYKNSDAVLSSRGLHHRSKDVFLKEVQNSSAVIMSVMKREKVSNAKYKPSPQLLIPHFQRALAYERLKQIDKAIQDYTVCLRIDSNNANAYFNRSGLYQVKGEHDKSLEDLNHAIAIDPSNIEYRKQRSLLYRMKGTYMEAVNETILHKTLTRQLFSNKSITNNSTDIDSHNEMKALDADRFQKEVDHVADMMEDPILNALNKHPNDRKRKDLEPIVDFLKGLKVFADFSNREGLLKIAKNIELHHYIKGKTIFKQYDPGHHFYIVLDGEISIIKNKKSYSSGDSSLQQQHNILMKDDEQLYDVVWKCYRGQYFGETALESIGGLRTAGAIATKPSNLMSLHVNQFKFILHSFKEVLKNDVLTMLKTSMLFEDWEDDKLDYLASNAIVRSFRSDTEIQKAGDKFNALSMIKSGIVKLIKKMPLPDTSYLAKKETKLDSIYENIEETPGLWILEHNWRSRVSENNIHHDLTATTTTTNNNNNQQQITNSTSFIDNNNNMVEFTVGVLGSGQVFGELAVLDNTKVSTVSAISSTAVELYCFDLNAITNVQCHTYSKTMNILTESLTIHDPPIEKIAYYYRGKFNWELRRQVLMKRIKVKTK